MLKGPRQERYALHHCSTSSKHGKEFGVWWQWIAFREIAYHPKVSIARHRLSDDRLVDYANPSLLFLFANLALIKFAIRTTIRNHSTLTRDGVIKQVADAVGQSHTVDLKNYDLLILVEIYKVRTFRKPTRTAAGFLANEWPCS